MPTKIKGQWIRRLDGSYYYIEEERKGQVYQSPLDNSIGNYVGLVDHPQESKRFKHKAMAEHWVKMTALRNYIYFGL